MENPIKMDDLGVPLFSETPIYIKIRKRLKQTDCIGMQKRPLTWADSMKHNFQPIFFSAAECKDNVHSSYQKCAILRYLIHEIMREFD